MGQIIFLLKYYHVNIDQVFNIRMILCHVVEMSDTKLSAAKPADNRDLRFVFFGYVSTSSSRLLAGGLSSILKNGKILEVKST